MGFRPLFSKRPSVFFSLSLSNFTLISLFLLLEERGPCSCNIMPVNRIFQDFLGTIPSLCLALSSFPCTTVLPHNSICYRCALVEICLINLVRKTVGSQVQVKIVKNKHAPPFKTAQFELEFGKGICRDSEIIELGCKHKFITKYGGAYYSMNGQSFHGKDAIKRYFSENEGAREELMVKLRERLIQSGNKRDEGTVSPDTEQSEEIITSETTDEEVVSAVEA